MITIQFKNDYFVFDGVDSRNHDFRIVSTNSLLDEDVIGLKRSIKKEDGIGDVPTFIGVGHEITDVVIQITKCTKGYVPLDFTEEDINFLMKWLLKREPKPLYIDGIQYYVVAKDFKKWFNKANRGYLTITFEQASPFGYSPIRIERFEMIKEHELELFNYSPVSAYEYLDIKLEMNDLRGGASPTWISFYNETLDETFKVVDLTIEDKNLFIYGEEMKYLENLNHKDKNMRTKIELKEWLRLGYLNNKIIIKSDGDWFIELMYQEKMPLI